MVVETPRGSGIKFAYDELSRTFVWSRPLIAGLTFPYDFGFLPQTLGDDGDALDALLLTDLGSHPGVVVPARVIGALRVEQFRDGQPTKRNDRLMLMPCNEHRSGHIEEVADLPARVREEIEAFFLASLKLTGKKIEFRGWADAAEAKALVDQAALQFDQAAD
jgi:inorganic pyrophosphatase